MGRNAARGILHRLEGSVGRAILPRRMVRPRAVKPRLQRLDRRGVAPACTSVLIHCLAALALQGRDGAPLESGLVRSLDLEPAGGTWVQRFRLERVGAREGEPPVGLARYVAGPDPEGGERVELELQYLARGVTVIHIEQVSPARRRLLFREVRERGGRTLFLEGESAGLSGYELGGPEVVKRELADGALPLSLIEAWRTGGTLPEEANVLDPLAASAEPLKLLQRQEEDGSRVLEARRADGSLRWRMKTQAGELRELRFQERGPLALPVTREEFESIRAQHELERSAQEAGSPSDAPRGSASRSPSVGPARARARAER
jgi:hypothetical protein